MILKVVYDDDSQTLVDRLKDILPNYPLVELETYHEDCLRRGRKPLRLKEDLVLDTLHSQYL